MTPCTSKQEYLEQVIKPAQRVCKRYGYLPSVLIAQACLENGYGMDTSCYSLIQVNNMIGQKSELLNKSWVSIGLSVWPGKSITKRTPEQYGDSIVYINDNFRVFDSIEQSLADFLLFLTYASNSGAGGKPKYGGEVLALKDPATLIRAVASRGYATGQTYPTSVMRIVNEHNLTQYDDLTTVEMTDQIPPALINKKEDASVSDLVINQNPMGIRYHNTSKRSCGIEYIYIHYVGGLGGAKNNIDYYNQTNVTDASADLYVGHQGEIWQYNIRPLERYCWAVGGGRQSQYGGSFYGKAKNANGISIEMCVKSKNGKAPDNPNDPNWYIEPATVKSTIALTKYLMKLYNIPAERVIRHFDVNGKYCPGVYGWNAPSGSDATWVAFKQSIAGTEIAPVGVPEQPVQKDVVWKVQLGAYKKRGNADNKLKMAKEKIDPNSFITEKGADGLYRVQVGCFSVYQNAVNLMNSIKERKLSDAIIKEYKV